MTNDATVVSNGLFTVTLDFGSVPFDGSNRWLDIGVRTNGGGDSFATLNPRQPITSAPYAITAARLSGTVLNGELAEPTRIPSCSTIPPINSPAPSSATAAR